ncbi:hypothetical protein V493_01680 [Pseudogymnoascus sp. VKM F-4281 (FW-2241)]|nr:hypothetical protein V493_01680 [Pseudogymnoascus sp. VKM F-4281 (FW-2241)]
MLATGSHSIKRSDDALSRAKKGRNIIDPGVHGSVSSTRTKQISDNKRRKRKRNQKIDLHGSRSSGSPSVLEIRGLARGEPQYNALRDKSWLCEVKDQNQGLTDANVAQLPEQSRDSFSIPTADVEEATAALSGSGLYINQQAHLRDIHSCISALQLASIITIECAIEKLVAERDRAGAFMCGVTRLSVTLATILFELTGSLDYVLPFSLSILVAKWTADALEPLSIYDLLMNMNSYPFLNNKIKPVFTSDLADITPRMRRERVIDISSSPLVSARSLREKIRIFHEAGEFDGGLPIIKQDVLVGLIPAPDLELALDHIPDEENDLCLMAAFDDGEDETTDPTNFTPYIDPAPVALDIHSQMDLVYELFVKLGLRYICVLRDGRYAGILHRKVFVKYVKELEESGH